MPVDVHAMWRVTNERGVGTASRLKKIGNIEIAGKTGTAQVYSQDAEKGQSSKKILQDHALFISYAPFENPEELATEEELIDAILFAESEHDWEEVERLYKLLFDLHDKDVGSAA